MSLQVILKNSSLSGKEPTATQLANGEIALNYHADGPFLTCKDTAGVVRRIGGVWINATAPGSPTPGEFWLDISVTPAQLKVYKDGTDAWVAVITVYPASTTTAGVVELATNAETQTGTDVLRAVTPASLQSKVSDSTSTTSSTTIASSTAVKAAKDVADAALPKAGGTMTGQILADDSTSATTPGYAFDGDPNTGVLRTGADALALVTGGTARLTISDTGLVVIPGDLTVNGTTTTINTEDLIVKDKNIQLASVETPTDTTADGGGITIKGATDKTLNWVNATDSFTSSENVDLASGKTYKINGTDVLSATALGSSVQISSSNIPSGTVTNDDLAGSIADTKLNTISTAGKVSNSATTATSANTASAIVARDASGNFSAGTISAEITGNASTATKLSSARNFELTGDVTGSVSSDLTSGASIFTSLATGAIVDADVNASAAIAGTKISPNFGSQNVVTTGTSTAASFIPTSSTVPTNGVYLPAANNVALSTNGAGRLFIDASGRVGVGTASPQSLLSVTSGTNLAYPTQTNAQLHINNSSGAAGALIASDTIGNIFFADTASNNVGRIYYDHSSDFLAVHTNSSERLRITSTGLVGIGTSSPGAILELQQSAATALRITRQNAVSNYCKIEAAGANSEQLTIETDPQNAGAGFIDFRNGAASKLRITSTGVGIGTTSPGYILDAAQSSNGDVAVNITNSSTGTGAIAQFRASNGTSNAWFGIGGTNYSSYAQIRPNGAAIYTSSSAGIGLSADNASGYISFGTGSGALEKARIDSSGRLLVGISSSITTFDSAVQVAGTGTGATSLHARFANNNAGPRLYIAKSRSSTVGVNTIVQSGDQCGTIDFRGADGTGYIRAAEISAEVDGTPGTGDMPGRLVFSTTADGSSIPTERMRISNDGTVWVNYVAHNNPSLFDTSAFLKLYSNSTTTSGSVAVESQNNTTSLRYHFVFSNANGIVGSISTNGSATAYTTSSDYRLKENVTPVTDGVTRLQQLKPSRFNFIADPTKTVDGFIAHEAAEVVPECVTGTKDEVDEDGNPVYQGIDQSKLVPLLTAALQEAVAKIESLEARLTAAGL